jgi:nucleoside-diphosphate-sugar epimerase
VTGANGCIGNVLVRSLSGSGHVVTALALDDSDTDKIDGIEDVKILSGNICDKERMEEIFSTSILHVVIHLAGIVHDPGKTLEECMEVNFKATSHLFDLSKRHGVEQFIFASTVAVFGEGSEDVLDEDSPVGPQTPYAVSKLRAEEYIKENHDNAIRYTIIRPATVYGRYDRGNINRLVSIAGRGFTPVVGDGSNRKSFIYVENLVEGIIETISNEKAYNEVFILSDSEPYSVDQTIEAIEDALGRRVVAVRLPAGVVIAALKLINGAMRTFGRQDICDASSIRKLTANNVFDISKARRLLRFAPRYALAEGLRKTYGKAKR